MKTIEISEKNVHELLLQKKKCERLIKDESLAPEEQARRASLLTKIKLTLNSFSGETAMKSDALA